MNKKKFFVFILFFILSIILNTFFWNKISLTYLNPQEIIGYYSNGKYHYNNEILRFLIFILIPLLIYFIYRININPIEFKLLFQLNIKNINNLEKNLILNYVFLTLLIILLLKFFSSDFSYNFLDLKQEGMLLTASFNNFLNDKIWTGNYILNGLFYEILNIKFSWLLFNEVSIGAYRFSHLFLGLLTELLIIFFCYLLAKYSIQKEKYKIIFFLINSIFFISIFGFPGTNKIFFKDIPLIFLLTIIIILLNTDNLKYKNFLNFTVGVFSVLAALWRVDIGFYYNATLIFYLFILIINKRLIEFFFILIALFIGWIIFFLFIGSSEFIAFYLNSKNIILSIEWIHGIIHPAPFSDAPHSTRATKNLMLIILNGMIIINLFISKSKFYFKNIKFFYLILFFLATVYYRGALGRSDGGHMGSAISFHLLIFVSITFFYILEFISNSKIKTIYLNLSLLILITAFFLTNLKFDKINQIFNFNQRLKNYVQSEDDAFLSKKQIKLVNTYNSVTKNQKCIQVFSYDAAIPYLLKKPSCTKYYYIWLIGSKSNQLKFINDLRNLNINNLLAEGFYNNWDFSPEERFPYIKKYLEKEYIKIELLGVENYKLFIKK